MAVIASSQITVSWLVDVSSITWYYLLQASTASPPSKTTTDPPTGGWTTTEPGYTTGSTNSLYVCQKALFSDGTFEYSDVSLSSSYEAAKAAYNQAVAAQNTANSSVASTTQEWSIGTSTASNGTWSTSRVTPTSTYPYVWVRTAYTNNSGTTTYSPSSNGTIDSASMVATGYITDVSNNGVNVHASDGSTGYVNIANGVKVSDGATPYDNYVSVDSNGISICNGTNSGNVTAGSFTANGVTVGATTDEHITIDSSGIEILDGNTSIGEFSTSSVRIGETDDAHISIDTNGMEIYVGETHTSETFTADGTSASFELDHDVASINSVIVDGTALASNEYSYSGDTVTLTTTPTSGDSVVIDYYYDSPASVGSFSTTGIQIGQDNDARLEVDSNGIEMFDENGDSAMEIGASEIRLGNEDEAHTIVDSDGLKVYAYDSQGNAVAYEIFEQDGSTNVFTVLHDINNIIEIKGLFSGGGSYIISSNNYSYSGKVVTITSSPLLLSLEGVSIKYSYTGAYLVGAFTSNGSQIGSIAESHIEMDGDSENFYDNAGNKIAAINSDITGDMQVEDSVSIGGVPSIYSGTPIVRTCVLTKEFTENENFDYIKITSSMYQSYIPPGTYYNGASETETFKFYIGTSQTVSIMNRLLYEDAEIYYDGDKTFTLTLNNYRDVGDTHDGFGSWSCYFYYFTQDSISTYQFGNNTTASASYSFAQGYNTESSGIYSFADGYLNVASGIAAHASGYSTEATGDYSFTMGDNTEAIYESELVIGRNNIISGAGFGDQPLFIIGDGKNDSAKHDTLEVYPNGRLWLFGSEDGLTQPLIYQQTPCRESDTALSGAPVGDNVSYGGIIRYDYNYQNAFYCETWRTTSDDVYTSYATQRSTGGESRVTNAFYQHIDSSGNPSITFSGNDTRNAWVSALGLRDTTHAVNGSSTSVATATDTTLCNTGSLAAGQYIIVCEASFAASTSGRRVIFLATSNTGANLNRFTIVQAAPSPSNTTILTLTYLANLSSATTFYLRAYQNSGSSLNVTGGIDYLRLHY